MQDVNIVSSVAWRRTGSAALLVLAGLPVASVVAAADPARTTFWLGMALVVALSAILMQAFTGVFVLRRPTIPGFFYLTYYPIIFIPALFVYEANPGRAANHYMFAVVATLLTVPAGVGLANFALGVRAEDRARFFSGELAPRVVDEHTMTTFLVVLLGGAVTTGAYIAQVDTLPIWYLLQNPGEFIITAELRQLALAELSSAVALPYYYYMILLYPLLTMISLGLWLETKRRSWRITFLATLALALLHASVTTAKSPVVNLMLSLFLFLFLYRRGRLGMKAAVVGAAAVVAFPVLVTRLLFAGSQEVDVAGALLSRAFYAPAHGLYQVFEVFPEMVPFLNGRSIGKLSAVLGLEPFNVANYMAFYENPLSLESGNANSPFLGNLHADFGVAGVLIGGVLAGFIMQAVQGLLYRRQASVMALAGMVYSMFAFFLLHQTALPPVLLSYGSLLVFAVIWTMQKVEGALRTASRPRALSPGRVAT